MNRQELRDELTREAEGLSQEIVSGWRAIGSNEVWLALPQEITFDSLPVLLRTLAQACLSTDFDEKATWMLALEAANHGDARAREGFDETLIYKEYHLLRRVIWDMIRSKAPSGTASESIVRIDAGISFATMASLRGFHRKTFEDRGEWPAALENLLRDWPLGSL